MAVLEAPGSEKMKNYIYVDSKDIGQLLKGNEVQVPDSPIVLSMLKYDEMVNYFHMEEFEAEAELEMRNNYCQEVITKRVKGEIAEKVKALETFGNTELYVSLDEVLSILGE